MKWHSMTSAELGAIERATPVFLSIAAVEQHGPHLPLATDAMIGGRLLDELDRRIGPDVLILPQLSVGCSAHHLDYAGTLSLRHATLQACVYPLFVHGMEDRIVARPFRGKAPLDQYLIYPREARNLPLIQDFAEIVRRAAKDVMDEQKLG